ncbi:MAG: dehydrogenase, short-chain alcohol dehydrogenase like [Microbacteriaceae bacterium]|nr:dehydrogenase, short-chain alcohol dehydrogenase like [Microbacteriaceae bacterium]
MSERMRIKTAIVTASANGLGRATAIQLASEGVHVALVDMDEAGLAETARLIRDAGGAVDSWIADCTAESEIISTVAAATKMLGPIEALVNNVGGSAGKDAAPLHEQSAEVIMKVINQCLIATILWSRAVLPQLREAGYGKIVSIASDAAFAGDTNMSEYSAAKAGVVGFTRAMAREQSTFGINVNAIAPGPIRTAALDRLAPDVLARAEAGIPLGHLGQPSDIAKAVAFMASTDADFITGQTLIVGGGRWMH